MNMTINFSQLVEQFKAMDRMVLIAIVVSALVVLYSGNLGLQWWNNTQLAGTLRAEADEFRLAARNAALGKEFPEDSVERRVEEFTELSSTFAFESEEALLGTIDQLAREGRLSIRNIATRDGGVESRGPMSFRVRTGTISVQGATQRILDFIDVLSLAAPGLTIDSVQFTNLTSDPVGNLTVRFLINPTAPGQGS